MSPEAFVKAYEAALGTQDWGAVAPLIHDEAVVVFSNGALHDGKVAIQAAYERNFKTIKGEVYRVENLRWLTQTAESAAYIFEFHWSGVIDGQSASGAGRGMAALVRAAEGWRLMGEHLGPKA